MDEAVDDMTSAFTSNTLSLTHAGHTPPPPPNATPPLMSTPSSAREEEEEEEEGEETGEGRWDASTMGLKDGGRDVDAQGRHVDAQIQHQLWRQYTTVRSGVPYWFSLSRVLSLSHTNTHTQTHTLM